ncbi:MAG: arsenite oxidase small subunit [Acidobacteriota bacterium]|jgi:Rieske Fe-S protein|nr:arsenite oxidase small subunit [Acidobacteriota bacterium]
MSSENSKLSNTIRTVLSEEMINATSDAPSNESDVRAATSPHQHDFPYDRDEEAQVTRREFCNFLALTSTALFVGAAGFAGKAMLDRNRQPQYAPAKIDGAETLAPNSSLNFCYPTEKDTAILVRARDGQYFAYGQKCTHLSCPVYFEQQHGRLECPCHEGGFDVMTGNVLYGPPPRPLDSIELEVREGGEVWAIGRKAGSDAHSG